MLARNTSRESLMAMVDGGVLIGRVLREQQVPYLFAINGGHTFPILANLRENGIKLIHMRHEQATAYAADAWAPQNAQYASHIGNWRSILSKSSRLLA